MIVKVSGHTLHAAMVAKLERMQPRMDALCKQQSAYESYNTLKRATPWYKRCTVWKYAVASPYDATKTGWSNGFFEVAYDELESAIRHMDIDAVHEIDSLDFHKYGLE